MILSGQLELLFSTDSVSERRPSLGEIQRDRYSPVLDGPGVRPDSRKRFAAGRWRHLYFTYRDCMPFLEKKKSRFAQEIYRDWKRDPSQLRLLHYAFELNNFEEGIVKDALQFLERYVESKSNSKASDWIPFIHAAILRTFISRAYSGMHPPKILKTMAVKATASEKPWFLRLFAWMFLGIYAVKSPTGALSKTASAETDESCEVAIELWRFLALSENDSEFRLFYNAAKILGVGRDLRKRRLLVYLQSSHSQHSEAEQILTENSDVLADCEDVVMVNRSLEHFAKNLGIKVKSQTPPALKQRTFDFPAPPRTKLLFQEILEGRYRQEQDALRLGLALIQLFEEIGEQKINEASINGGVNPFSIQIGPELSWTPTKEVAGWKAIDWSQVRWIKPEVASKSWAWPLGLLLRAALTGKSIHLYGAPASARYSLFMSFKRLNFEGAFCSEAFADLLMCLLRWPGADINAIADLHAVRSALNTLLSRSIEASSDGVQLLPVSIEQPNSGSDVALVLCQVDSGLTLPEVASNQSQARRALLYTLEEVERKLLVSKSLAIQLKGNDDPFVVVVLPELFVVEKGIGDVHRFVKKNGVAVLLGRYFWKDSSGNLRNSLYWVFPTTGRKSGPSTFAIRQDKFFPTQEELGMGVIGANPKVIWRISFGDKKRVCALNCYEVTNPGVKGLLSGRVEAVFVSAYNTDVATFDGLIKTYSYDIFGFVALANTAQKGEAAFTRPIKDPNTPSS